MSTGRVVVALSAVGMAIIARSPLEQTMPRHMLMQLPKLFGAGMLMGIPYRCGETYVRCGVDGTCRAWPVCSS